MKTRAAIVIVAFWAVWAALALSEPRLPWAPACAVSVSEEEIDIAHCPRRSHLALAGLIHIPAELSR